MSALVPVAAESIDPRIGWPIIGLMVLLLVVMSRLYRRSRDHLPDDAGVAEQWRRHGFEFTPSPGAALMAAGARVRATGVAGGGAGVLGLPASSGVRLPAVRRGGEGRPDLWVGDVWDVTSVTTSNDRPVAATVELRMVAAMPLPVTCPRLLVGQETALSQLLDAAGVRDIQLESDAFNRAWRVRCDDPRFAHAVVTPQLMAALQDAGANVALAVEGDLLTVHELKPGDGRSGGQAVAFDTVLAAATRIADIVRPETWPGTGPPVEVHPDAPRVTVDPRPPGTPHPRPARRDVMTGWALGFGIPVLFIVVVLIGMLPDA